MFQWGIYGLGALCLLSACHKTVQNETVNTPVQAAAHVTDAHVPKPIEWASCHRPEYQS